MTTYFPDRDEITTVVPKDLWGGYEGPGQFAPEDPILVKLFDQALTYELMHRGVPPEYRNAYEMPPQALDWAMAREERPRNLILSGPVGVGKTHSGIAAGTLYAAMHNRSFKFLQSGSWLRTAKNWDSKAAMEDAKADGTVPGVVLLDDIGRTKASETDVETFSEMMDNRRMHLKPTIFTTNLLPEDFESIFGAHLTSRLLGSALVIVLDGEDRR